MVAIMADLVRWLWLSTVSTISWPETCEPTQQWLQCTDYAVRWH